MKLSDNDCFLELVVTDRSASDAPDAGDTRFAIRARITAKDTVFTVETWCWVGLQNLVSFAGQLRVLEERREGSAVLESLSPFELSLEIRSIDRAGHVAAVGRVGHDCFSSSGGQRWSVVEFEIPFCPSELPALVREFNALSVPPGPIQSA